MVYVTKATGEKEAFSEDKVRHSIARAGIEPQLENQVLTHVLTKLYDGIPTSELYKHITEFLGNSPQPYHRARYSLKQSIMELGPTGYPFEDFLAEVLKANGYKTLVRQTLSGKCITHEVDVVAQKNAHRVMIEAKFHNMPGIKTNVHVALYTKARFDDVLERNNLNQAWLFTNTKMTSDVIGYCVCMGMKVTSWNYPDGESLRELIERASLIPITALTTLSLSQKQMLLTDHVVLCKDICKNPSILAILNLPEDKHLRVLEEAAFVCQTQPRHYSDPVSVSY
ncbi:MAG: restriction endonuclease [Candidatus Levybacteria bacterium]|nr:restriction endonuclease [Candidatus Levybacteria bacterium]